MYCDNTEILLYLYSEIQNEAHLKTKVAKLKYKFVRDLFIKVMQTLVIIMV